MRSPPRQTPPSECPGERDKVAISRGVGRVLPPVGRGKTPDRIPRPPPPNLAVCTGPERPLLAVLDDVGIEKLAPLGTATGFPCSPVVAIRPDRAILRHN